MAAATLVIYFITIKFGRGRGHLLRIGNIRHDLAETRHCLHVPPSLFLSLSRSHIAFMSSPPTNAVVACSTSDLAKAIEETEEKLRNLPPGEDGEGLRLALQVAKNVMEHSFLGRILVLQPAQAPAESQEERLLRQGRSDFPGLFVNLFV